MNEAGSGLMLDGRGHPARVCLRIFEASGCGEWPTALIEQLGPHHYGHLPAVPPPSRAMHAGSPILYGRSEMHDFTRGRLHAPAADSWWLARQGARLEPIQASKTRTGARVLLQNDCPVGMGVS